MIKSFSIDWEVVHENFHDFLDHVRANRQHAPLEWRSCITQPKWHSAVSICSIRIWEHGLFLGYRDGWEFDDDQNNHQENRRRNDLQATLTFNQWRTSENDPSKLPCWVFCNLIHIFHPMTVCCGIKSFVEFSTIIMPHFLGTTCIGNISCLRGTPRRTS